MRYQTKKQILIAVVSIVVLALLIGLAYFLNERRHPNQGEDRLPEISTQESSSIETTLETNDLWADPSTVTYEDFLAMTPDEQAAFQDSFPTGADYVAWFWDAWDAYEAAKQ